jgi:hypothetical protein
MVSRKDRLTKHISDLEILRHRTFQPLQEAITNTKIWNERVTELQAVIDSFTFRIEEYEEELVKLKKRK